MVINKPFSWILGWLIRGGFLVVLELAIFVQVDRQKKCVAGEREWHVEEPVRATTEFTASPHPEIDHDTSVRTTVAPVSPVIVQHRSAARAKRRDEEQLAAVAQRFRSLHSSNNVHKIHFRVGLS
jgi:hypothetical protein